jgi:hypothetical protein
MDADETLVVSCAMSESGWECHVKLNDQGREREYLVTVSSAELQRFAHGQFDPTRLVVESFRFLLARESPGSILGTFAVSDIERYFPEYGVEMPGRTSGR